METWSNMFQFFCQCVWVRMPFREWNIKKTSVGFIFLTMPRLGKDNPAFLSSFQYILMFSGDHLFPKTPGSEVMSWSWKQKLVGVSRTCGISLKIIKIMKTKKNSKNPKNNNYFTCLLLFRMLVNLPKFEMVSQLNKLDLCGLF